MSFELLCGDIVKKQTNRSPVLRLTPTLQPPQTGTDPILRNLGLLFLGGGFPNPFAEVTRPQG